MWAPMSIATLPGLRYLRSLLTASCRMTFLVSHQMEPLRVLDLAIPRGMRTLRPHQGKS